MIHIDKNKLEIEGSLRDIRLELTIIMSEIRDMMKVRYTDEEIDAWLYNAVDASGKSCEQSLDNIAEMIDEIKKEL